VNAAPAAHFASHLNFHAKCLQMSEKAGRMFLHIHGHAQASLHRSLNLSVLAHPDTIKTWLRGEYRFMRSRSSRALTTSFSACNIKRNSRGETNKTRLTGMLPKEP
jgi:hypothetical protein